jgi:hypothetical protein
MSTQMRNVPQMVPTPTTPWRWIQAPSAAPRTVAVHSSAAPELGQRPEDFDLWYVPCLLVALLSLLALNAWCIWTLAG